MPCRARWCGVCVEIREGRPAKTTYSTCVKGCALRELERRSEPPSLNAMHAADFFVNRFEAQAVVPIDGPRCSHEFRLSELRPAEMAYGPPPFMGS